MSLAHLRLDPNDSSTEWGHNFVCVLAVWNLFFKVNLAAGTQEVTVHSAPRQVYDMCVCKCGYT